MKHFFLPILALVALAVSACSESLFSSGKLPDETRVIDGPTLAVPPQFNLRPPREGEAYEDRLSEQKTREAQTLIMGGESPSATTSTPTEEWLLMQAGQADPNIREALTTSATTPQEEKGGFLDRLMGRDEKK